jgi:hypothetical protein
MLDTKGQYAFINCLEQFTSHMNAVDLKVLLINELKNSFDSPQKRFEYERLYP